MLAELTRLYDSTLLSRSEAIEFIEANLSAGATPEIDASPGDDAAVLQTIHGAKGLEYPIVILANLNHQQFPHYGVPSQSPVRYDDLLGLRQTKVLDESTGRPHVFDSWQYDVLSSALPSEYDEERRLLYVAMTRAKRHLLCTAGDTPSNFFTDLSLEPAELEPAVEAQEPHEVTSDQLSVSIPDSDGPIRAGVHDIMDESVYEDVTEGRGKEFGQALHDFAEAYALGETVTPDGEEQAQVARLIDSLAGTLSPEQTVLCPLAGDPRIILTGIIDLLHVSSDRVDIIDYKTDIERHAHEEYRIQISVYWHVLQEAYPDRDIRSAVYYTADDELVAIDPLNKATLRTTAENALLH
jgi:ATP-dependent helicase/nuclease subunit A